MAKTIIYAEDDEDIRGIYRRTLERTYPSFNVETYGDGTSLRRRLEEGVRAENIGIVLTDNDMPGGRGLDIARDFLGDSRYKNTKFIVMSGADISEEARKVGVFGYLGKPILNSELTDMIDSALETK